jgi:hypothetical protein
LFLAEEVDDEGGDRKRRRIVRPARNHEVRMPERGASVSLV